MGQSAYVLWFTGLSGSGKSTLADLVAAELRARGQKVERLDGDIMRQVFPKTGFDRASRDEHIRRVGFLASRLEHHGVIVIASFISPYRQSRDFVRGLCDHFVEIHVKASLEECARRDVKGLYKKVQNGEIGQFTGISDPYEEPENPEIVVNTELQSPEECVNTIMNYISRF